MSMPLQGVAAAGAVEVGTGALDRVWAAARAWGVTRLADITGLDRVGVPVFQAVRPRSRALCVHQGKALDPLGARLGALMESLESAHAEAFEATACVAAYADLPPDARAPDLADFGVARRADLPAADEPMAWAQARRLLDDRPLLVPLDSVSLDFTRDWDRRLDHTSSGLGARFDVEGALRKALFEAIERDAETEWRAAPDHVRAVRIVDRASIPYPWFLDLDERLGSLDIGLSLYTAPSLVCAPVVRCVVNEAAARRKGRIGISGWGCAATWEAALEAAVLEAMQARLTAISGVRDDILYDDPTRWRRLSDAPPLPPGMARQSWAQATARSPDGVDGSSAALAAQLAAAGYPDTAMVELSAPGAAVCVVKVFTPGLGANRRRRRPPNRRDGRP